MWGSFIIIILLVCQEDAHVVAPSVQCGRRIGVFAVFDGHGGAAVSDYAQRHLLKEMRACAEASTSDGEGAKSDVTFETLLPEVFRALDDGLLKELGPRSYTQGATAVTVVLDAERKEICVAHTGDSRAILCRGGVAVALTHDHKPMEPSEYARIVAAGGYVTHTGRVNGNLNLSRALGDFVYKSGRRQRAEHMISAEPDVCSFRVGPSDDFLLLACDGLWELVPPQDAINFVRARLLGGRSPKEIVEQLLDEAISPSPAATREYRTGIER